MPNTFAYIALLSWPAVMLLAFIALKFRHAILFSIFGAYLLLPSSTEVDVQFFPAVTKETVASFALIPLCLIFRPRAARRRDALAQADPGWIPRHPVIVPLLLIGLLMPIATWLTNTDPIYDPTFLPGLTYRDAISGVATFFLTIVPFLVARKFFSDNDSVTLILFAFVIALVVYSPLMLLEVRLSPQFHSFVYGFHPSSFLQTFRFGGFRPLVFTQHGLHLALLAAMSLIAAVGLIRIVTRERSTIAWASAWLLGVLILVKSFGAWLIALAFVPLARFARPREIGFVLMTVSLVALSYPMLRQAGLVPTDLIVSTAAQVSEERASSLGFRFDNEERLIERANERPLFGWGGWARNRIFASYGADISVTDGRWVILFGFYGWVGYIALFGLFAVSVFVLGRRRYRQEAGMPTLVLGLIMCAALVDLMLNSSQTPITLFVSGALAGRMEALRAAEREGRRTRYATRGAQLRAEDGASSDDGPAPAPGVAAPIGALPGYGAARTRSIRKERPRRLPES